MAAVDETLERYGRVDVLLYATGINVKKRDVAVIEPADWNAIIDTNLNGAYNFVQAVLPAMRRQQDGQIIMISSVSGRWTDFSGSAYQASKHGLNGLTHAITLEERKNGIRATTILPGLCHTPIVDSRPIPLPDETKALMMQTEDIAAACVFAASLPAQDLRSGDGLVPNRLAGNGRDDRQMKRSCPPSLGLNPRHLLDKVDYLFATKVSIHVCDYHVHPPVNGLSRAA